VSSAAAGPKKKKTKKKKKAAAPRALHRWGRPIGVTVGGTSRGCEVHHDMDALAETMVGMDPSVLLTSLGFPPDLEFTDTTKLEALGIDVGDLAALGVDAADYATAKEAAAAAKKAANKKADKALRDQNASLAPWCFLAWQAVDRTPKKGQPPRNLLKITHDGNTVNTRLLLKKIEVLATLKTWNKDIKFVTTEEMRTKGAALLALCPKLNGNGVFMDDDA
jgi:hypothetical protein